MSVNRVSYSTPFGRVKCPLKDEWKEVQEIVLYEYPGIEVSLLSYGATINAIYARDDSNSEANIVLGFDDIEGHVANKYFGSTVGRCANRIKDGKISLEGRDYQLTKNENATHHLHGGNEGFHKRIWDFEIESDSQVTFKLTSSDGEDGYPGKLEAEVTYKLLDNKLHIDYKAFARDTTIVNMTNHSYYNLAGFGSGKSELGRHLVHLENVDRYLPVDAEKIPTGEIKSVVGTPFDFTKPKHMAEALEEAPGNGFDHCLVLRNYENNEGLKYVGEIQHGSGRFMKIWTTNPGLQFYTANHFPEEKGTLVGSEGKSFLKHGAIAVESQIFPNAVNQSNFPNVVVRKNQKYNQKIVYEIGRRSQEASGQFKADSEHFVAVKERIAMRKARAKQFRDDNHCPEDVHPAASFETLYPYLE